MRPIPIVFFFLWLFSPASQADTRCEIDLLLDFIGKSQCNFIRNAEAHDSADARAHIERKYKYAKRWVETTEQFIEYTATKSSTTDEPYRVTCSGREELSADWLKRELARLRAESKCKGT
jgi:hypothetical protein